MEPIAPSAAGAVFRPAGGGSSEVAALLRDGRVLGAEVLTTASDGSVLLAIGRHSIPAESELRLDPGARFLVRVEQGAAGVVLRILAPAEGPDAALLKALRAVVGEERPLGQSLGGLARSLRGADGRAGLVPETLALAEGLGALAVRADGDGGALRALLAALGLGHEAALAAHLGARAGREGIGRLRGDLKALLLRAQLALQGGGDEHGPLRESVSRALAGLEAEQLLNLARERSGEPLVLSFPVPDGDGWASARLAVPRRREHDQEAEEDAPFRLVLGVELSNLGPVRADLALAPGLLALRLLVTRAEVLRRVESALGSLRERAGDGRRALELSVRLGTPAEATRGLLASDIRYLREHHLMNVAG